MDQLLAHQPFLMGNELTVLDIAWLIYVHRLSLAGYPFERLHPNVFAWKRRLSSRPEFEKEIGPLRDTQQGASKGGQRDRKVRSLEEIAHL